MNDTFAYFTMAWFDPSLLLLTALLWPVRALVRRHYGAPLPLAGRQRLGYRLSRLAALLMVLVLLVSACILCNPHTPTGQACVEQKDTNETMVRIRATQAQQQRQRR